MTASICPRCDTECPDDEMTVGESGQRMCVECATYEYAETDLPEWAS